MIDDKFIEKIHLNSYYPLTPAPYIFFNQNIADKIKNSFSSGTCTNCGCALDEDDYAFFCWYCQQDRV
jgi:hypothetical protein